MVHSHKKEPTDQAAFQAVSYPVPWPCGPRRNAPNACLTHASQLAGGWVCHGLSENGVNHRYTHNSWPENKRSTRGNWWWTNGFRGSLFPDKPISNISRDDHNPCTGKSVPNQQVLKEWQGFDHCSSGLSSPNCKPDKPWIRDLWSPGLLANSLAGWSFFLGDWGVSALSACYVRMRYTPWFTAKFPAIPMGTKWC
jgi:hypothetical protein